MVNTKNLLFDEIQSLCELDNNEQIFVYLFDYFSVDELIGLVKHIKEEKGL